MANVPFIFDSLKREKAGLPRALCVNIFAEETPSGQNSPVSGLAFPGLSLFSGGIGQVSRGTFQKDGVLGGLLFDVVGDTIYSVAADGSRTALEGKIASGTTPVAMVGDKDEVIAHAGTKIYRLTETTVTPIADYINEAGILPDIYGVAYVSGFFLYVTADGVFAYSEANDGDSIGALNYAEAESSPDGLQRIVVINLSIFLIGTETIEEWVVTGDANLPFTPRRGAEKARGCINRYAAIEADNTLFFVGDNGVIYRLADVPKRISTSAQEEAIADAVQSEINMFKIEYLGHVFVVVETSQGTFAYDAMTQTWPELRSWDLPSYGIRSYATAFGKLLVGMSYGGLYALTDTVTKDPRGKPMQRLLSAHIRGVSRGARGTSVQLMCRVGVGTKEENPKVSMRYSKDAGKTWSAWMNRSLGKVGRYALRVRWNRLGLVDDNGAILQFRITDDTDVRLDSLKVNER